MVARVLALAGCMMSLACTGESESARTGGSEAGALSSGTGAAAGAGASTSSAGGDDATSSGSGAAAVAGLQDLWAGTAHFVIDQPVAPLPGVGHREAFAVHRPDIGADTLYLYHRCFDLGVPAICLSISADLGASFPTQHGVVVAPAPGHVFSVAPSVARVGDTWTMVYEEGGTAEGTAWATSPDGITWTPHGLVWPGTPYRATPSLYVFQGTTYVFYVQFTAPGASGLAVIFSSGPSMDQLVQYGGGYVLAGSQPWDVGSVSMPRVVFDGAWHWMIYEGATLNFLCGSGAGEQNVYGWGVARSADLKTWEKYPSNPIMQSTDAESCGNDMPQPLRLDTGQVFVWHTSDDTQVIRRQTLAFGSACAPNQSPPNWQEKNQACLASCGGLGGSSCYPTKDCAAGVEVGDSWDCASCCK